MRPLVARPFFGQRVRGNFGGDAAMMQHAQHAIVGDAADFDGVESPFVEYVEDFALAAAFGDQQHALLRFAEHHFVRRHAGFALRHASKIDFDAHAAARGHFRARAGQPGRAHILNRDHRAGAHRFEARFEQQFFHERVADLDVGPLLLRFFAEFRRGEQRSAVNAVAAGFRADVNHGIARRPGAREKKFVVARDAERQRVDQRIIRVARLEHHFAADRRHAEAVAVKPDAANHAVQNAAVARDFFGAWRFPRRGPAVIGPKRSESSTAIGRAPMVKMSRRIPPTPVAAP